MTTATTPLAYPTNSLDRGLRLLQLVRDFGAIRVMDAAAELGVSRSSAHRLLQALVHRGFLQQDEDHLYEAGPALSAAPAGGHWAKVLRDVARPHMGELVERLGYASNLLIYADWHVRFIDCVTFPGSTYDLSGSVLKAHRTAAGRVLLSHLDDGSLEQAYASPRPGGRDRGSAMDYADFKDLMSKINRARRTEYSVSLSEVDRATTAVGTLIRGQGGAPVAALTVSSRTPHAMQGDDLIRSVDELFRTRHLIEAAFEGEAVAPGGGV